MFMFCGEMFIVIKLVLCLLVYNNFLMKSAFHFILNLQINNETFDKKVFY